MKLRVPLRPLACIALAMLLANSCLAQTEPPALSKLRSDFEQRARLASGALNDYYERALAALETTLAAAGDYEQARVVKTRREDLASNGIAAAGVVTSALPLSVETAKLSGGLVAKSGELQGWRTAACSADWTLSKFTPGSYQLQFSYTMAERPPDSSPSSLRQLQLPVEEALFTFREASLLAGAAKNSRNFKLSSTKGEVKAFTVAAPLDLSRPPMSFRLTVDSSYPANIITIRDIKLVPVAAASPVALPASTTPVTVTLAAEWQQLQQNKTKRLIAARKPVIEAYSASLSSLLPPGSSNEETTNKIEAEKRRLEKLIDDTTAKASGGMKLDNYEDVSGATFIPDPANTGDRFKIEHDGRQYFVRLAWVACPPIDPADKKRLKTTSERFSADELELLNLGRNAQEFTALYLEGHPLRLLVKPNKKPDEESTALVFLDDIGLFQSVLLDHGLAVVDAPPTLPRGSMELGLLKGMQDRENAARKQKSPPGGWGLKDSP